MKKILILEDNDIAVKALESIITEISRNVEIAVFKSVEEFIHCRYYIGSEKS